MLKNNSVLRVRVPREMLRQLDQLPTKSRSEYVRQFIEEGLKTTTKPTLEDAA